jgi:O-antigen/teichoic acid export membrane protein
MILPRVARTPMSSLAGNSLARFIADSVGLVFGMIAGVITARWLGPTAKGMLSTLTFLSGLFMQACCMGLGDAAVVLVGQKRASIQEALSATLIAILISATLGMAGLWTVCAAQFRADMPAISVSVLVACAGLPVTVYSNVLSHILNVQEQIVATSAVLIITAGLSMVGTWLFIVLIPLSVLGGVLAGLLGSTVGLATLVILLTRRGLWVCPRWNTRYLLPALRYGVSLQAAYLLMVMSARADLILVYSLAGQAAAGQYSVALTFGVLVSLLPFALSYAAFPRLAHLEDAEAFALTTHLCRCGFASALLTGIIVLFAVPLAIPLLFGQAYRPAIWPAEILLLGGIFGSGQWLLCRASAARGSPALLFLSFGASLTAMCALDYLLIPQSGIVGAAAAAAAGPALGLVICLLWYRRFGRHGRRTMAFMPTAGDFRYLALLPLRLLGLRSEITELFIQRG